MATAGGSESLPKGTVHKRENFDFKFFYSILGSNIDILSKIFFFCNKQLTIIPLIPSISGVRFSKDNIGTEGQKVITDLSEI